MDRTPAPGRRGGYVIAIAMNAVGLWVTRRLLEWGWPRFLTDDFKQLLPILTVSFVAGMAVNAVLVALGQDGDEALRWGRSYLDHLRALADADETRAHPLSAATRTAAAQLLAIPVVPGASLVQLGHGPHSAAQRALAAARTLVDDCSRVARLSSRTD